jgi:hypothetical protein
MSYKRVLTGSFEIKPPLPWGVYHHLDQMDEDKDCVLKFVEDIKQVDREEGQLIQRSATGIVPATGEAWRDPAIEIRALAWEVEQRESLLVGAMYSVGEDGPLDTWRHYTNCDGRLVSDQAILVWPDGRRAYQAVPHSSLPGCETYSGDVLVLGSDGPTAWFSPIDPAQIITGPPWQR